MKRTLIALSALFALAGCSSGEVKLGVDVGGTASSTAALRAAGSQTATVITTGTTTTNNAATLSIDRVRILVNDAKIQSASSSGGGKCMGGGGSADRVGPFVVDLSADEILRGAHRDFSLGSVASGTYKEAEIEIEPLRIDGDADDGDSSGAEFADFKSTGASLLVDGKYNGKAFQFAGHFKAEQEKEGSFTVDSSTSISLPLVVSPASWFKDSNGNVLDPTDAAQHSAIAVAICKTLDAGEETETAAAANAPLGGHDGRGHGHGAPQAHCVE
jgi:Prokaryotic membrane lipoprotein lipid attachment site